ncbi:MAG: metallophosphoesterase [Mariniphaga sp.]|nr:metallophosphoesterase [Mariniphaga sp.]
MNRLITLIILSLLFFACSKEDTIKFAVFSDAHNDIIHDAKIRLELFIEAAEKKDVDFIIELGDFCLPFDINQPFLKIWNSFNGSSYHVLGNHDIDVSPKIVTQQFLGMDRSYYSFDKGDFHFIVLDANFIKNENEYIPYSRGNYFNHSENRPYIPGNQLEWLKKDIAQTNNYIIIFSHQSLEHWGGVKNREKLREIFNDANKERKKVIACFCGHDHEDRYAEIDGIHYIGIRSLSFNWVGEKYQYEKRFPSELNELYPNLKYTMPYRDPLYAFIELDPEGRIMIIGKQSTFIPPDPRQLGISNTLNYPKITSRKLEF